LKFGPAINNPELIFVIQSDIDLRAEIEQEEIFKGNGMQTSVHMGGVSARNIFLLGIIYKLRVLDFNLGIGDLYRKQQFNGNETFCFLLRKRSGS